MRQRRRRRRARDHGVKFGTWGFLLGAGEMGCDTRPVVGARAYRQRLRKRTKGAALHGYLMIVNRNENESQNEIMSYVLHAQLHPMPRSSAIILPSFGRLPGA